MGNIVYDLKKKKKKKTIWPTMQAAKTLEKKKKKEKKKTWVSLCSPGQLEPRDQSAFECWLKLLTKHPAQVAISFREIIFQLENINSDFRKVERDTGGLKA